MTHDDDLPAELKALADRLDPEPEWLRGAAKALYTWRTVDAELAELTWDSLTDEAALTGVRGTAAPRLLTFQGAGVTLDLQIEDTRSGRRLLGQLAAQGPAQLEIRHRDGTDGVALDELGRFVVEHLPGGPVSFRTRLTTRTGDSVVVDTAWELV
ncbi:MAG: hypothetical protein GEU74_06115 [Nitriliruptorales bacterium]|nr:hypothetical protein [Nitriliruptorales bacterium]